MESASSSGTSRYSECIEPKSRQKYSTRTCTNGQTKFFEKINVNNKYNDNEEINQQNLCNKRSEKLSKPCQNGFCYCFTSDSDQHVQKRKPKMKFRKQDAEISTSSQCSDENSTEKSDFSEMSLDKKNTFKKYVIPNKVQTEKICQQKQYIHQRRSVRRDYLLTAKTSLDRNLNAPLIHIVQEIHEDGVISEVKINKQRLINRSSPRKMKNDTKKPPSEFEYFTEKTLKEISCNSESENLELNAENKRENETKEKKKKNSRAGQLLQRRVSEESPCYKKIIQTPPKKPPRRLSESTTRSYPGNRIKPVTSTRSFPGNHIKPVTSLKEADIILNKFLKQQGYNVEESEKLKTRKSFPLEKPNIKKPRTTSMKTMPSCPSLSDIEQKDDICEPNVKIGWVNEKISKMLTYEDCGKSKVNFTSLRQEPKPQMGWVIPPKEDIDTVDGDFIPIRDTDNFNNFAKNMELKSTPIKSATFINDTQPKKNDTSCVTPDNKSKSDLSLTLRAKESTCEFFKHSAKKIANLVSKISSKEKIQNKSYMKNVSCQTTDLNYDNTFEEIKDLKSNNKKARFSLQSPPGSYFSSSPKKNNNIEEFDFNRKINSPNENRLLQRRLSFSPKKIIKTFSYRPENRKAKHSEFYKSYQSDINGDFSLNIMNDILLNIKAKLEASDKHASDVFNDVRRNEMARRSYHSSKDTFNNEHFRKFHENNNERHYATNVDIHNFKDNEESEIYSEIEEEEIVFTGSPSIQSLNEISHFYANNDPNAEYAEVRKVSKSKLSGHESCISTKTKLDVAEKDTEDEEMFEPTYAKIDNMRISVAKDDIEIPKDVSVKQRDSTCFCKTLSNKAEPAFEITRRNANQNEKTDTELQSNSIIPFSKIAENHNPIKELFKNKIDTREGSVNIIENVCSSTQVAVGSVEEGETKTVKELVDYFETSLCTNNTCNQNHSASYESPNDTSSYQYKETSTTFQELKVLTCEEDDLYDEIPDNNIRSKSCPLPEINSYRESSIGNQSCLTYLSDDKRAKLNKINTKTIRYQLLKHQFRKSIKKGKSFFKKNLKNYSLNDTINSNSSYDAWEQSNLGITQLFTDNEDTSWQKQLEKAVFICRKLPILESSIEAVEAERLLLYSKLKANNSENNADAKNAIIEKSTSDDESCIIIDEFELPIQSDIEFSDFFNFFYVGVFTDGHRIISTNYAEKRDKLIVFRNCNISFENINQNTKIKCDLYILRLRKVLSTKITKEQIKSKMEEINCLSYSKEQLLSRFKFQGSFQLIFKNFTPFQIDEKCERKFINSNKFCLHSIKEITLPIDVEGENSLLLNHVNITAKLEIVFTKFLIEGFLNVRSLSSEHDWNKRWCKVENFTLLAWNYPQDCNIKTPILNFNLIDCINEKIEIALQDICPRPKSFNIKLQTNQTRNLTDIYFSADNQIDLNYWLNSLNIILDFQRTWM